MSRYVEMGTLDVAITGKDWTMENASDVIVVCEMVYSKTSFRPTRWVLAVPQDSPIQTLQDLSGKDVAFVSPDAFAGYWLPMDALLKSKVRINVVFTGNQEASSAQLRVNKVSAAARAAARARSSALAVRPTSCT